MRASWATVLALADRQLLLPAVWDAGRTNGRWAALPEDALLAVSRSFPVGAAPPAVVLQRAHQANAERNADLLGQASSVLAALAEAGVPTVPLKGLHTLLHGWWPRPSVRVLRDLDILVPDRAAATAVGCLHALGYRRAVAPDPFGDHELPAMSLPDHAGAVELHIRPLVSRLPAFDLPRLLAAGRMTETEAVLHTVVHAQLQDEGHLLARLPLRTLHEISLLSAGPLGPTVDWEHIRVVMRALGAEPALDGFLALARDLFAADVPAPRRRLHAYGRVSTVRGLTAHPRLAWSYEKVAFQRRQLEQRRLSVLATEERGVWAMRLRHVAAGTTRSVREVTADLTRGTRRLP